METFFVFKVSCRIFVLYMVRHQIINKSTELFLTLGFKSVTMDDIANELGMSKKTIYVHFKNKTKLVEAVTFSLFECICEGIDAICEGSNNPIEELYDIKMFVMHHLKNEEASPQHQLKKYYPNLYETIRIKHFEVMHESVGDSLQKGIDTQVFRSNIDVAFISRMYFNGMNGIKDDYIFPEEKFNKIYLMESYLEYHLRAIVTEKGLTILNNYITQNQS